MIAIIMDLQHYFTLPINRKDYLKQKYLLGFILGIFFLIIASTSYYQIEHSLNL